MFYNNLEILIHDDKVIIENNDNKISQTTQITGGAFQNTPICIAIGENKNINLPIGFCIDFPRFN